MAIDDPLDATPALTFSTWQFENESFNIIVTSSVAVLIVANICSIITKLVYRTDRHSFRYDAWLRAFIFASTYDPMRVIFWLLRRYAYRENGWERKLNRLKPQRLVVPLLARFLMLACSVISVSIALPTEKKIVGCKLGNYEVGLNPNVNLSSRVDYPGPVAGECLDIPITSRHGQVPSRVRYCSYPIVIPEEEDIVDGVTVIFAGQRRGHGAIHSGIAHGKTIVSSESYIVWQDDPSKLLTLRTNLSQTISMDDHLAILVRALTTSDADCQAFDKLTLDPEGDSLSFSQLQILVCNKHFSIDYMSRRMDDAVKKSLTWKKTTRRQIRIGEEEGVFTFKTDKCPFEVLMYPPLVSVGPLAIVLIVCFVINLSVSAIIGHGGNALDAAYHIIKEVLAHDCTSNPLEENPDSYLCKNLELRKWHCTDGGAHVGFIGRENDVLVNEFRQNIVVCACARTAAELAAGRSLHGNGARVSLANLAPPPSPKYAHSSSGSPYPNSQF